jgi:hypothetical protein
MPGDDLRTASCSLPADDRIGARKLRHLARDMRAMVLSDERKSLDQHLMLLKATAQQTRAVLRQWLSPERHKRASQIQQETQARAVVR